MEADNYQIGDEVIARFTNSAAYKEFRGRIVGKTLNYWKVESLEPVWNGEPAGRVFRIATLRARNYSGNNCIAARVSDLYAEKSGRAGE